MPRALAPRSLWQIIGDALRLYRRHPGAVFALGAAVPLLTVLLPVALGRPVAAGAPPLATPGGILQPHALLIAAAVLLVFPLVGGAVTHAVYQDAVLGTVRIGRAVSAAWQRCLRLVAVALLVSVSVAAILAAALGVPYLLLRGPGLQGWPALVSVGWLVLAAVYALYLALRYLPYLQTVLVEGRGPVAACARCFRLTKGHVLRTLGLVVCLCLLSVCTGALLSLVWDLGPAVAAVTLSPVFTIAFTLLYLDLRVRHEGYTAAQLAADLGLDADAAPSQA